MSLEFSIDMNTVKMVNNIFQFIFRNRYNSFHENLHVYGLLADSYLPATKLLSQLHAAESYLVRGALSFMNVTDEVCVILTTHKSPV